MTSETSPASATVYIEIIHYLIPLLRPLTLEVKLQRQHVSGMIHIAKFNEVDSKDARTSEWVGRFRNWDRTLSVPYAGDRLIDYTEGACQKMSKAMFLLLVSDAIVLFASERLKSLIEPSDAICEALELVRRYTDEEGGNIWRGWFFGLDRVLGSKDQ